MIMGFGGMMVVDIVVILVENALGEYQRGSLELSRLRIRAHSHLIYERLNN